MKNTLFRSSFVLLLLMFIILSCEREEESIGEEVLKTSDVVTAKSWFEENEANLLQTTFADPEARTNFKAASKKPDWNKALVHSTKDGKKVIEVKLDYDTYLFYSNKEEPTFPEKPNVLNSLLLFERKPGKYKVYILKVFPENPNYLLQEDDFERINYGSVSNDFSGSMMVFDWKENFIGGWKIKDGAWYQYIARVDSKKAAEFYSNAKTECYTLAYHTYSQVEGEPMYYTGTFYTTICFEFASLAPPGDGDGGGGGTTYTGEDGECYMPHPYIEGMVVRCDQYEDFLEPETDPTPEDDKPCEGDPVKNPEIAPQTNSGIEGGMHGCTRHGGTCVGANGKTKWHDGVDIKNDYGEPIYAMYDGLIYNALEDKEGAGYWTQIQSTINGQTFIVQYYHMQKDGRIKSGTVKAGNIIGYQGDSGNLQGAIAQGLTVSHVHIGLRLHDGSNSWNYKNNFTQVDPRPYLATSIDDNGVAEANNNCN